jgi:hypothetical protein
MVRVKRRTHVLETAAGILIGVSIMAVSPLAGMKQSIP